MPKGKGRGLGKGKREKTPEVEMESHDRDQDVPPEAKKLKSEEKEVQGKDKEMKETVGTSPKVSGVEIMKTTFIYKVTEQQRKMWSTIRTPKEEDHPKPHEPKPGPSKAAEQKPGPSKAAEQKPGPSKAAEPKPGPSKEHDVARQGTSPLSSVSSDDYEKYEDLAKLLPLTDSELELSEYDMEIDPSQNH